MSMEDNDNADDERTSRLYTAFIAGGLSDRLNAVKTIMKRIDSSSGYKAGPIKRLCRLFMSTLFSCQCKEKSLKRLLIASLLELSRNEQIPFPFGDVFTEIFLEYSGTLKSDESVIVALNLSLEIVESELRLNNSKDNNYGIKPWISTLIFWQGSALDTISAGFSKKPITKAHALVSDFLLRNHYCFERYIDAFGDQNKGSLCGLCLILALLLKAPDGVLLGLLEKTRALVADMFNRRVLVSKSVPSPGLMTCFAPYLETLAPNEWEGVEGVLVKTLKKAPESASTLVACVTSLAVADMSGLTRNALTTTVVKILKSGEEAVRNNGKTIVANVCRRCKDTSAAAALVLSLRDALSGKAGGIALPANKQAILAALGEAAVAMVGAPSSDAAVLAELSCQLAPTLLSAAEKDGDEGGRLLGIDALTHWLAVGGLGSEGGGNMGELLRSGLAKPKSVASLHTMLLSGALLTDINGVRGGILLGADRGQLLTLLPALLAMVREALKKPSLVHLDALFATHVLTELAAVSVEAADAIAAAKLWGAVFGKASFLFCPALWQLIWSGSESPGHRIMYNQAVLSALRSVEIACCCFSSAVNLFPDSSLDQSPPATSGSSGSTASIVEKLPQTALAVLVLSGLHRDLNVRRASLPMIVRTLRSSQACGSLLSECLLRFLTAVGEDAERARLASMDLKSLKIASEDAEGAAASSNSPSPWTPPSSHCSALLLALLGDLPATATGTALEQLTSTPEPSVISNSDPGFFSRVVLLCGNPLICPSQNRSLQLFQQIVRLVGGPSIVQQRLLAADESTVALAEIVKSAVYSRDSEFMRVAGRRALTLLCDGLGATGVAVVQSRILPLILVQISSAAVFEIDEGDLAVYLDPSAAKSNVEVKVAEDIKITNADRKKTGGRSTRKGTFGADLVEDEDWAEQVKREKAKKLGLATSSELSDAQARRAAEVDAIVNRVAGCLETYKFSVEAVRQLAETSADVLLTGPVAVVPAIIRLLASKPLTNCVMACLLAMCNQLESEIQSSAWDLANAIRIVVTVMERPLERKESWAQRMKEILLVDGPVARSVGHIQTAVLRGVRLRASSVQLIFPVLRGVLSLPTMIPGCEGAFMILDSCWSNLDVAESKGSASEIQKCRSELEALTSLRKHVLELSLGVLAKFRVEPPPDALLIRAASQQELPPGDWTPLLGTSGLLNVEAPVRNACLRTIMTVALRGFPITTNPLLESRLWLSRHDEDEAIGQLADTVWVERGAPLSPFYHSSLFPLLGHEQGQVRLSAGRALAGGMIEHPTTVNTVISKLKEMLISAKPAELPLPSGAPVSTKSDKEVSSMSGKISQLDEDTQFPIRAAVATAIQAIGEKHSIPSNEALTLLPDLVLFVLDQGVVDPHQGVRDEFVVAGRRLLDGYGAEFSAEILGLLETLLASKPPHGSNLVQFDLRHEAAVVLLGAIGRHLTKESDLVSVVTITKTLVAALSTPSESVQKGVADCLSPLVQTLKLHDITKDLLEALMKKALDGESYGDRRGAAYGISAFVKGLGVACLKQYDLVTRLKDACTSGSIGNRQGALFAFECLSDRLGLLFEPYIITVLPILLKSFSHSSDLVREAAQAAAKVIMARLSAHGVKQVLTPILNSLTEEHQWKSRQEAIRLLGTMAHCAPKQLASCLPQIVPRLVDAGSDPHPKVKESAKLAMNDISSVIRNPEVKRLGPTLLAALADPATKTREALDSLLECEFMHSIDAPSLALLVPILGRALRDRSADLKRRSSAITGNICSMITDPKILVPYLYQVLPGLKEVLVDPIPDVRASSAKALGSLITGVGEAEIPDLLPWLLDTLVSDLSPVERSGAAQGLAEVCRALGQGRTAAIIAKVLKLRDDASAAAREGMQWLLSFLPTSLRDGFASYIPSSLPVVLEGLSDGNEGVREVALRGGQVIVSVCGRNHALSLIPSLSDGMFHEDWRIRQSSVSLLGELLYQIGDARAVGVSEGDEDDDDAGGEGRFGGATSRVIQAIRSHLGEENANEVFASLYIVRSDISITVRQIALQVWKSVVSNTPRTLREIMPLLVLQIVEKLSSDSEDLRTVTGRALGEVVKKLGDFILPEIVPELQANLCSDDEAVRQGVCLGLSEILLACTKKQAEDYVHVLVPALQEALCDPSDEVRSQAAAAFQQLHKTLGPQAIVEVVPSLLLRLSDADQSGLLGLRVVVQVRPRDLLEYLLPKLFVSPISITSANALGSIAAVAGVQLTYHYHIIISGFISELTAAEEEAERLSDSSRFDAIKQSAGEVFAAITDAGVINFVTELGKEVEHDTNVDRRRWGCWLTGQFCSRTKSDYSDFIPVLLKHLMTRVADMEKRVLVGVIDGLNGLFNTNGPEVMMAHVDFIRSCVSSTASDSKHRKGMGGFTDSSGCYLLPLFTVPGSLDPFFPTFIHALLNGTAQQRESGALGIAEFSGMTDAAILKPYLIKTAGPLIRVIGDRFPSSVKFAILQALAVILDRGSASLRAFVPQLQTTFVKALSDPSKQVRVKAAATLGQLMGLSTRIDPLLLELSSSAQQAESVAVRASIFEALAQVLEKGGSRATAAGLDKCHEVVLATLDDEDENVRNAAARCAGGIAAFGTPAKVSDLILDFSSSPSSKSASGLAGRLLACGWALRTSLEKSIEVREDAIALFRFGFEDERAVVKLSAASGLAICMEPPSYIEVSAEHSSLSVSLISSFANSLKSMLKDSASDVKLASISAIKNAAKYHPICRSSLAKAVIPSLTICVSEISIGVKVSAERAMKYLLEIGIKNRALSSEASGLNAYVNSADAESSRFIKDYAKRVLARLTDDSDDESATLMTGSW